MRFLRFCIFFVLSAAAFSANATARDGAREIPPLGTQIVFEYENRKRVWRNVDVYTARTQDGLHRWDSFGLFEDGSKAKQPWRRIYRDDLFRVVRIEKGLNGATGSYDDIFHYAPHMCGRTIGPCSYVWTRLKDGTETTGEGLRNRTMQDGWLVSVTETSLYAEPIVTTWKGRFNKFGMATEMSVHRNGFLASKLRLSELVFPD